MEASVIYPVIILAMVVVICIVISMYMAASSKAGMNLQLKEKNLMLNEIGSMQIDNVKKLSNDKYSSKGFMTATVAEGNIGMNKVLECRETGNYHSYGLVRKSITRGHYCCMYNIDEVRKIRRLDMVGI